MKLLVAQSCAIPWTVARQAPLSMGFSRQEFWSGLSFPPPRHLINSGTEPVSPALGDGFFTTEPLGKPLTHHMEGDFFIIIAVVQSLFIL